MPVEINGYGVLKNDEDSLKNALLTYGPISITFIMTKEFKDYGENDGVFFDSTCQDGGIKHAALLVGYGTLEGQDYWLVKNSMGQDWGMNGYILMARNNNNMCGIASEAMFIY